MGVQESESFSAVVYPASQPEPMPDEHDVQVSVETVGGLREYGWSLRKVAGGMASSQEEALRGVRDLVRDVVGDLVRDGEVVPAVAVR